MPLVGYIPDAPACKYCVLGALSWDSMTPGEGNPGHRHWPKYLSSVENITKIPAGQGLSFQH